MDTWRTACDVQRAAGCFALGLWDVSCKCKSVTWISKPQFLKCVYLSPSVPLLPATAPLSSRTT
jgi:hypothetical protein